MIAYYSGSIPFTEGVHTLCQRFPPSPVGPGKNADSRRQQLLEDIRKTKCALDCAYSTFENVVDPDLIDCSIDELKAVQMRYRFLLKQAEQLDLTM